MVGGAAYARSGGGDTSCETAKSPRQGTRAFASAHWLSNSQCGSAFQAALADGAKTRAASAEQRLRRSLLPALGDTGRGWCRSQFETHIAQDQPRHRRSSRRAGERVRRRSVAAVGTRDRRAHSQVLVVGRFGRPRRCGPGPRSSVHLGANTLIEVVPVPGRSPRSGSAHFSAFQDVGRGSRCPGARRAQEAPGPGAQRCRARPGCSDLVRRQCAWLDERERSRCSALQIKLVDALVGTEGMVGRYTAYDHAFGIAVVILLPLRKRLHELPRHSFTS